MLFGLQFTIIIIKGVMMTEAEMKEKLVQAQSLLSDIYHYAVEFGDDVLEGQMSCADSCIGEALDMISMNDNDDGQPDEAQEWHDFDPEC
jgi:hypothetical protein